MVPRLVDSALIRRSLAGEAGKRVVPPAWALAHSTASRAWSYQVPETELHARQKSIGHLRWPAACPRLTGATVQGGDPRIETPLVLFQSKWSQISMEDGWAKRHLVIGYEKARDRRNRDFDRWGYELSSHFWAVVITCCVPNIDHS